MLKLGSLTWLFCSGAYAAEVALDVGQTLTASGAVSARGGKEFDFNRVLAVCLASALTARGLLVRPINFDDCIESLETRPQQACGADFFISIHHDSVFRATIRIRSPACAVPRPSGHVCIAWVLSSQATTPFRLPATPAPLPTSIMRYITTKI